MGNMAVDAHLAGTAPAVLSVAVSPEGRLSLEESAPEGGPLPPEAAGRIRQAFEAGPESGLLHLAAAELETPLPPALSYWRDFARLFLTELCKLADLEERREDPRVQAPREEFGKVAEAAPPMTGGEYITPDLLEHLWTGIPGHIDGVWRLLPVPSPPPW